MQETVLDFLMGLFLANALPHYMVGILNVRFLSLFGYSGHSNIYYGYFCVGLSLIFFHLNYGIVTLSSHAVYLGGLSLVIIYFITGRFLIKFFQKDRS